MTTDQTITTDQAARQVVEQPEHVHVFEDRWYPLDKKHVRRVCVLPGCHHVEVKEAKA